MKVYGSAMSLSKVIGLGWTLTIHLDDESVGTVKTAIDQFGQDTVSLDIKRPTKSRSLDANNYAWVLIGKIAVATRTDKMSVYRQAIRDLGDNYDFICVTEKASETFQREWRSRGEGWLCDEVPCRIDGCRKFQIYYGSSSYDTRLMSALIDRLVQDAKDLGIETMPPRELEVLKNGWS